MGLSRIAVDSVTLLPTEHGWVTPQAIGTGGRGNEVIAAIWSYQMSWDFMTTSDFKALYDIWNGNQGSDITASLPELGAETYTLKSYTCRINPIQVQGFREGHYMGISTMLVGIDITL